MTNAGRLVSQLAFSTGMEDELMTDTESMRKGGKGAATRYRRNHPELLAPWLQGVTTRDGKDGLAAVRASLGQ
jgi:glycine betaine/proline transport system substrate-binding protein